MLQSFIIESEKEFVFSDFKELLGGADIILDITPEEIPDAWGFHREGKSTTMFTIERSEGAYSLSIDNMASYEDFRFMPYLIDTLSIYLTETAYEEDGKNAFELLDEDWVEETIGEEVAYLKCLLSIGRKYYVELPIGNGFPFVSTRALREYGVCIYSSTSRIYGYTQYMMRNGNLPVDEEREEEMDETTCENIDPETGEAYIDVPQHESIGIVHSWQTDGAVTTECYSAEDAKLLITLAEEYKAVKDIEGVVLNDVGTLYENGIGVEKNIETAVQWYKEAIKQGDLLYAPTSLGDIYRKGVGSVPQDLNLALKAYRQSKDPYSWYRIGQSYEEGWVEEPDMQKALEYYHKAADVGHHLALLALKK